MKRLACLLFLAMTSVLIVAAADNQLTEKEKAEGWLLLFDGKTLNGWITSSFKPSLVPVDNGCINPHKCGGYMMMPEKIWSNFVLSLDYKTSKDCNSGVLLRAYPLIDVPGQGVGYHAIEMQIEEKEATGYYATGALYDLVPVHKKVGKPVGEWNHAEITCNKNLVNVIINGEEVSRMDLDEWREPNKRPDGSSHKFNFAFKEHSRKGYIGLQDHGAPVWFKNIKLKPLA